MKTKTLIIIILLFAFSNALKAQINNQSITVAHQNDTSIVSQFRFTMPQLSKYSFDLKLQSLQFTPRFYAHDLTNNYNFINQSIDDLWTGSTSQRQFEFQNIPINATYQFDINGRLRSSSMQIKLGNK